MLIRLVLISIVGLLAVTFTQAQQIDFPGAAVQDPSALSKSVPRLAREVIAVYRDDDRRTYLDNLFRLQMVAGQYTDANKTLTELRALAASSASPQIGANNVQYEIFAMARVKQGEDGSLFDETFRQEFRKALGRLDDRTSALLMRSLTLVDQFILQRDLNSALEQQKGRNTISLTDALKLIRAYQAEEAYRSFAPLTASLIAEDDSRRYRIDKDILVRTPDGANICAMVVRPRAAANRLPALLNFTIYADPNAMMNEARRTASNGYAGVEALTRGKGCSPDKPVPYEHDGADAAAVIDWISRQAWSDGRAGMYGGSYDGFTQWAAAKHMPRALKALMPSVTLAPGIDVPMDGNLFLSRMYP